MLTGGASRRMGQDKARLSINGEVLAGRIARDLQNVCARVTILGKELVEGFEFLADTEEFAGPLVALSRFEPRSEAVFVASCDLPRFDARLVDFFQAVMGENDAVLPVYEDKLQPLCALYRASCWRGMSEVIGEGRKNVMAWLDRLSHNTVMPDEIAQAGIDRRAICGANTPEEWDRLLRN